MSRDGSPSDHEAQAGVHDPLDRRWHLARDGHEVTVAELEYALIRAFEAFGHWQAECFAAVTGASLGGSDNAILHVIRMKDRPKSIKELARLMNRDDIPNIQYSLRKLTRQGLIEKITAETHRKGVTYTVTEKGRQVTEAYAELRRNLLLDFTRSVSELEPALAQASRTLDLMTGIYEQAARIAATHRGKVDERDSGPDES